MNTKTLLVLIATCFVFFSCDSGSKNTADSKEVKEQTITETDAVCIWDGGSIRETPESDGKYVTKMALGEKITWLGISENDTTKEKSVVQYHKVRLSDGTEGWASEYVIVTDATPAVIINEVTVYTRPDLINATDKKLEAMDFIAVIKTEDNWCEFVGEKNKTKGWIQKESVSYEKEDIAVALLAGKAFDEKDEEAKKEKIKEIIENTAFVNSVFIENLKSEIEEPEKENVETEGGELTESTDSIPE